MEEAIISEDTEYIKWLIDENVCDYFEAFRLSSKYDKQKILNLLSSHKPNILEYPNDKVYSFFENFLFYDNDLMFKAIDQQDIEKIKKIINKGKYDSLKAIKYAKKYPLIKKILENSHSSVSIFYKSYRYQNYKDDNDMIEAIEDDNIEKVKELIKYGSFNPIKAINACRFKYQMMVLIRNLIIKKKDLELCEDNFTIIEFSDNELENNEPEEDDNNNEPEEDDNKEFEDINDDYEDDILPITYKKVYFKEQLTFSPISSSLSSNTTDIISSIKRNDYELIRYYICKNNYDVNKALIAAKDKPLILRMLQSSINAISA